MTYLVHAREWKNHKYISKKRGPGGKWIYKYKEAVGLNARANAKLMQERSRNVEMENLKALRKYNRSMRGIENDRTLSTAGKMMNAEQLTADYQATKTRANKAKLRADAAVRKYQNTPLGKLEGLANKGKAKLAKLVGYKRAGLRRVK